MYNLIVDEIKCLSISYELNKHNEILCRRNKMVALFQKLNNKFSPGRLRIQTS